jgi:hypothetical protein
MLRVMRLAQQSEVECTWDQQMLVAQKWAQCVRMPYH